MDTIHAALEERKFVELRLTKQRSAAPRLRFSLWIATDRAPSFGAVKLEILWMLMERPGVIVPYKSLYQALRTASNEEKARHTVTAHTSYLNIAFADLGVSASLAIARDMGVALCEIGLIKIGRVP